jgi:hypothetical protein
VDAGAELADEEAAGAVAPVLPEAAVALVLPEVEEMVAGPTAVGGAASKATVAATGSDEGASFHLPAAEVP